MSKVQKPFRKLHWRPGEGPDPLGSRKQEGALDQAGGRAAGNASGKPSGSRKRGGEGRERVSLPSSLISQCNREIGRLLPREALVPSRGLDFSVSESRCTASASGGHGVPFSSVCSPSIVLLTPAPLPTPGRGLDIQLRWARPILGPQGSRLFSQGGGHAGTRGPHAPPGKHQGPSRLEHEGLGSRSCWLGCAARFRPPSRAVCLLSGVATAESPSVGTQRGRACLPTVGLQTFLLFLIPHKPGDHGNS